MLTMKDIIIVTVSPPDELDKIPVKSPVIPSFLNPSYAPLNKVFPKFVIGTVAPASLNFISMSYIPKNDKRAPAITKNVFKCAGVRLVYSSTNCPIAQINPQIINAFKYIIY